jgi:exodeoxyribonuclease VII large subunit
VSGLALPADDVFGGGAHAALSVSQLTRHIAGLLRTDEILADVWVRGEVGNVSRPSSGHLYFALKDETSCISCAMWRGPASLLSFRLEDGAQVLARGHVDLYERRGTYQLIVEEVQPDGLGALYLSLEQLKRKLEAEGLFAVERKRPLPAFPRRVAVVTSLSGAAVHDMCTVLSRSAHPPAIVLVPAAVQGLEAPASLCAAIALANDRSRADVLIVGRGGGSAEDLAPFNTEPVVRAIAGSAIPVISAVGHETDFTLADFAADERCPTPTAAAELLLQRRQIGLDLLEEAPRALRLGLERCITNARQRLAVLEARRALAEPLEIVARRQQRLDDLSARLAQAAGRCLERRLQHLALLGRQMDSLSPLSVLQRGFGRVSRLADGEPVRSTADVEIGIGVRVALQDGAFDARVTELHPQAEAT